MESAVVVDPSPRIPDRAPAFAVPAGACDAHLHVFPDPARYPLRPTRHYTPALCRMQEYAQTARPLGITRAVVVQPSVYGFDNAPTLDALAEGPVATRGVVVIEPDVPDTELARMHALGVRGVRANLVNANGLSADDALRLSRRLRPRGWHLQLNVEIENFKGLDEFAAKAGVPIVIDHFGTPAVGDPDSAAFRTVLGLVERGQCWVKISGQYRFPQVDTARLARALAAANPDRLLWASDWPHCGLGAVPMPDDVSLIDDLGTWFPDAAMRHRILVENPARLYWS